ncbi:DUF5995 family protein [Actinomadura parmotrematis]|uniref:Uncharacterized protein n=1 Tax=Actinomadura parmotrematis TaxID=2864039 RepID=A0ABS7FRR7_9ACTN|nr:DUF5995 family protein [Actinomadura parmotrematis]MBW8483088.1 hypothetical protein [Actinomadura parmotrematis]
MDGTGSGGGDGVGAVIARMREIGAALPAEDGVARFNRVYLRVTELVAAHLAAGTFEDPAFVARLDEVFAGLYFANVDDGGADPSWRPLFECRRHRGVWNLQYVLAGMNAHINHDLALAVIATCEERGVEPDDPPVHADFRRVNGLLAEVEAEVRREVEPELLRLATREAEGLKHIVGSFSVARARDLAWFSVRSLWPIRHTGHPYRAAVGIMAESVGLAGRLLLTPVAPDGALL